MSAIEVLKREKEHMQLHCGAISNGQWIPRDLRLAFGLALLCFTLLLLSPLIIVGALSDWIEESTCLV